MNQESGSIDNKSYMYILFSSIHDINLFDNKPLPENIYNSGHTVVAKKGQTVAAKHLKGKYIRILKEDRGKILPELKSGKVNSAVKKRHSVKNQPIEESSSAIEERLKTLGFEPFPKVRQRIREDINHFKKIFKYQIVGNVLKLDSKDNMLISRHIAEYMDGLVTNSILAADYIGMVEHVRRGENYLTFSHACGTAFFTASILYKLKILQQDVFGSKKALGRWVPVKTRRFHESKGAVYFSENLLKYFDHQKNIIKAKYDRQISELLQENLTDLMHQYSEISFDKTFPSMQVDYSKKNRLLMIMAAINLDIGKLWIPSDILYKTEKLTEEEFRTLKKHPVLSVQKLKEIGTVHQKISAYILCHHVLTKGYGYPDIQRNPPVESTIIACADMYDAMRSPKPHRSPVSQEESLEHFKTLKERGLIDLPLYLAAVHTFEEYKHKYINDRIKKPVTFHEV